ncbi:histidine--tRNA ligase [Winogradskyella echinorum]|uniref:Histidine--tRNA ligase n=1 Tax=Winogradskyella echinorum TaxID=538189 RepID=A0ABR6Y1Y8_9FLAO|nr:histidine--tRNA ligase [Winogradskyella echinorum]MBC3846735.1 histidine--tRNA ligase [Winogradskyella echinorum]MBC5751083.1 histidine--tRNA ligase [Winogradskyella echinorum]
MAQKPSIPKGTRDFNAAEVAKRSYIMETIKEQFQVYGFQPIETPSFENSETLMGKYGDEGDRLIFKILNSGDYFKDLRKNDVKIALRVSNFFGVYDKILRSLDDDLSFSETLRESIDVYFKNDDDYIKVLLNKTFNIFKEDFLNFKNLNSVGKETVKSDAFIAFYNEYLKEYSMNSYKSTTLISEKALRYDLTVPFARYVVQHQNEIEFPFKRYQIQPVWRADRPQKGRFREFYQCDADVVGSKSLFQEVEFVQLYDAVFSALQLEGVIIKINNRKILSGIAEVIGAQDKLIDFTVALDKLDKIGEEKVKEEMRSKGISEEGIAKLQPLFTLKGDFGNQVESLKSILNASEIGLKGIEELEFINTAISNLELKTATLQLDVTLARGLNYYTGAIFEVSAPDGVKMGSIGGGGRYDDLTGIFGLKNMSGVGISFGLDRIYLVLEELGLFPDTITEATKVLFISFGDEEAMASLKAVSKLRENGVKAELYPDAVTSGKQMKKQMTYANRRNIPYVVLVGEEELNAKTFALKHMESGEQTKLPFNELLETLK